MSRSRTVVVISTAIGVLASLAGCACTDEHTLRTADGRERSCTIEGGGHTSPGTDYGCAEGASFCDAYIDAVGPISDDLDGPAEAWAFFAAHLAGSP